jgi:hypothetical protein
MILGTTKLCLYLENNDIIYKSINYIIENSIEISHTAIGTPFGFKKCKTFAQAKSKDLINIEFEEISGSLICTNDHQLQNKEFRFQDAILFRKGNKLPTFNDKILTIKRISPYNAKEPEDVYSIIGTERLYCYYSSQVVSKT